MLRRQRLASAIAILFAAISAQAQEIRPGRPAPASVVDSLKGTTPVTIGPVSVRPMSSSGGNLRPQSVAAGSESTLVVRASDNLVGVSSNDLVVIYPDTAAVVQSVSGKSITAKPYHDLGLVVVHVATFDQIQPLQQELAKAFPNARFDLPVRYFRREPK